MRRVLFLILICSSFVFAVDVSVYQGQYYVEGEFLKGTFDFDFDVYDSREGGSLVYNDSRDITTGDFGEWHVELEGISRSARDVDKNYYMEISVDGVVQGERRLLTQFDFVRKDAFEESVDAVLNVNSKAYFSDLNIGGRNVCLEDGTNCLDVGLWSEDFNSSFDLRDKDSRYINGSGISLIGNVFSLVGEFFSGSWSDLVGIPEGFRDGVDDDSWVREKGGYYNKSEVDSMVEGKGVMVVATGIKDLIVLEPREEPEDVVAGVIYFDEELEQLRFFDGEAWRVLTFEGESEVVKKVKEEVKEADEDVEVFSGGSDTGEVELNVSVEEEDAEEDVEEESEVCEEVCEEGEEVCEDVEVCEEVCEEGKNREESCKEVCESEEVCEAGEEVCKEVCGKPEQLFDIRMDLEESVLGSSGELVAVVTYESFGSVPTPVDLTFEIFDLIGDLLYSKNGSVVVSTEEVTRIRFLDLDLEDGEYEFVFTTLYNVDVRDEFRQKFVVGEKSFFARVWDWIRFWS